LLEGFLNVVDILTAHNIIVTGTADFLGNIIFHNDIILQGRPTFNSDTAGFALIKKGSQNVNIIFDKEYSSIPVVTASISLSTGNNATESAVLSNTSYVIINRNTKGFTIKLNNPAQEDTEFSWTALSVANAKTSVSN